MKRLSLALALFGVLVFLSGVLIISDHLTSGAASSMAGGIWLVLVALFLLDVE